MPSDHEASNSSEFNTSGGATVGGDVNTGSGAFIGRDQISAAGDVHIHYSSDQPPADQDDESPAPGVSPYQGMAYFDVADADRFFGREQLTVELIGLLRSQPLLAVVGASGSGKSSLVRAGLVAALQRGQVRNLTVAMPKGSANWAYHIITPTARPLESLAASLTRNSESVSATSTLINDLAGDSRNLHLAISRLLSGTPAERLLLVVDQFEELFTLCRNPDEQRAFIDSLLTAALDYDRTVLLITLRADFYSACARFEKLRSALDHHQKYIGPMSRTELQQAIEAPAAQAEWTLEPGLVQQILDDVGDEPGALPLLAHALQETWKRRSGRQLTLAGYVAAGGVKGAIAKTADDTYNDFSDPQKAIARTIFLRLTELGEGVQDTRRRIDPRELQLQQIDPQAVRGVLTVLADARLLTTDAHEIQLAHEAVIRAWPRLREWLADDREGQRIHRHLTEAAKEWQSNDDDPSDLYRGNRLNQTLEWAIGHASALSEQEAAFLQTSQAEAEAVAKRETALADEREAARQREMATQRQLATEQTRRARIFRNAVVVAAVLFLLAAGAAGLSFYLNRQLDDANTELQTKNHELGNTNTQLAETVNKLDQTVADLDSTNDQLRTSLSELQRQAHIVRARQLAAQSGVALGKNYQMSLLLAAEAVINTQSLSPPLFVGNSDSALHAALESQPGGVPLVVHTDHVSSVAFSTNGKWLATASADKTIRIWQVGAWETEPVLLSGHEYGVNTVAFSADNKWLASGSEDNRLRVWRVGDWEAEPLILEGHKDDVSAVAFSADNKWLASGSWDNTIRIWHVGDWETEPLILHGQEDPDGRDDRVTSVAFSADNKWLASGNLDNTLQVWRVDDWEGEPLILKGHTDSLSSVTFSADNKWLVSGSWDKTLRIWRVDDWLAVPVVLSGFEDAVNSVAFSTDGKWLAGGSSDTTVRVWRVALWDTEPIMLRGHEDSVSEVAFSADSKWLASGSGGLPTVTDNTVRVWRVGEWTVEPTLLVGHEASINSIAFSADGQWLASGGGTYPSVNQANRVQVWHVDKLDASPPIVLRGYGGIVNSITFSPDSAWLATGNMDSTIRVWRIGDWEAPPIVLRVPEPAAMSVAFSADGQWLASGSGWWNQQGAARIWRVGQWETEPIVLSRSNGPIISVTFSADGKWLALGNGPTIEVWQVGKWDKAPIALHQPGYAESPVAFSANSQWLASGGGPNLRVWRVNAWETEPVILRGMEGAVTSVAFSGDDKWLAAGSADHTVRMWRVDDWEAVPVLLLGHEDKVSSVAFSTDGQMLASGSWDKTIRVWTVSSEQLVAKACRLVGRNFNLEEWLAYIGPSATYRPTCPGVRIPEDAIYAIKDEAHQQIYSGQIVSATQLLDQLNKWLQADGQFKVYGFDTQEFVANVSTSATAQALPTPTFTPTPSETPTPAQPASPLGFQQTSLLPSPTDMHEASSSP